MKRHAPATMRNREPILEVLRERLSEPMRVLEIASGTGEHARYFASILTHLEWQPTDLDESALESIEAHRLDANVANLQPPRRLDVREGDWGELGEGAGAIVCINMIHIAPWACCQALMRGAGQVLPSGGLLITYGPYRVDGGFTAPSNERFDAALKSEDPSWGLRDLDEVTREAEQHGLSRQEAIEMPANNHVLVFRRD